MTIFYGPRCTCDPGRPHTVCPVHYWTPWPSTWKTTTWRTVTPCRGRHCKHDSECAQPNS